MRRDQSIIKASKGVAIILLLLSLAPTLGASDAAQDLTFRLMNIERRLDQLQIRVDNVERAFQNQAMSNTGSSNASTQALLELQQRQLLLAEQLVTMQRQMLELRKEIDRLAMRDDHQEKDAEKKDAPKQEANPKVQTRKP